MVIKSIRPFFLLLAGLAIIVHMIVPHDHHLAGQLNVVKDSCPFSHEKSDHRPFFPAHCNAFNDLAADKFSPVIVRLEAQTSFTAVIWRPDNILPGLHHSLKEIENSGKTCRDIYIPDFSPFTAPPSLS